MLTFSERHVTVYHYNDTRLLFDKIASVYFIWKKIYWYFSIGNGERRETALCRLYVGTVLFAIAEVTDCFAVRTIDIE